MGAPRCAPRLQAGSINITYNEDPGVAAPRPSKAPEKTPTGLLTGEDDDPLPPPAPQTPEKTPTGLLTGEDDPLPPPAPQTPEMTRNVPTQYLPGRPQDVRESRGRLADLCVVWCLSNKLQSVDYYGMVVDCLRSRPLPQPFPNEGVDEERGSEDHWVP